MSEVETNPVEDLVQAAMDQNYTSATDIFSNLMGEKMAAALDQTKIALADQIFNGAESEEDIDDEELDLELDDEDLEVDEDEDEEEQE